MTTEAWVTTTLPLADGWVRGHHGTERAAGTERAMTPRPNACPEGGPDHTPLPTGYLQRADRMAQLARTGHRQSRCPACGLYAIWTPTPEARTK